ncbi:MAG: hypothetical protein OXD50_09005 [Chloroflexi bacterium]|nr:hypothetical protein [Chloroflexota bacterium]
MIRTDSGFFTFTASLCFGQLWRFRYGGPACGAPNESESKPERQKHERSQQPQLALTTDDVEDATHRERQARYAGNPAQSGADEHPASKRQAKFPSQWQLES